MGIVNVAKVTLTNNRFVLKTVADATARDNLTGMTKGSMIFNQDEEVLEFWDGNEWTQAYRPTGNLVYEFTSTTFQSGIPRGQATAPTSSQMQGLYSGNNWYSNYFGFDGVNQLWTVPGFGLYRIEAGGARGGKDTNYGITDIWGARCRGEFELEEGTQLSFMIGSGGNQYGSPHGNEAGGGGGTFVVNATTGATLMVAGGGGGSAGNVYGNSCSRNTQTAYGQTTTQAGITTCQGSYTAPTPTIGQGGSGNGSYWGGGGGGFFGNGSNGYNHCGTPTGGQSYTNGGVGGPGDGCYTGSGQGNRGGFGGGGGGNLSGPGGAGGYTGGTSSGAWSSYSQHGGGGGSFNAGANQINTRGGNSNSNGGYAGAGYVKVELILD